VKTTFLRVCAQRIRTGLERGALWNHPGCEQAPELDDQLARQRDDPVLEHQLAPVSERVLVPLRQFDPGGYTFSVLTELLTGVGAR